MQVAQSCLLAKATASSKSGTRRQSSSRVKGCERYLLLLLWASPLAPSRLSDTSPLCTPPWSIRDAGETLPFHKSHRNLTTLASKGVNFLSCDGWRPCQLKTLLLDHKGGGMGFSHKQKQKVREIGQWTGKTQKVSKAQAFFCFSCWFTAYPLPGASFGIIPSAGAIAGVLPFGKAKQLEIMASFLEKLFSGRVVVLEMALQSSSSQQSQIDWDFLANCCNKRKAGCSSEVKILQRQPWRHKAASFSLETNKAKDQNSDSAEPQRAHIPLTCPFIREQKDMY